MKLKLFIMSFVVMFVVVATVIEAEAQTVPNYGITPSGKIFIREDLVDRLSSGVTDMYVGGNWIIQDKWGNRGWVSEAKMSLFDYRGTGVYVFDAKSSGNVNLSGLITLYFTSGNTFYFPQAAFEKGDPSYNPEDVQMNPRGDGRNLVISVGSFDF